MREIRAEAYEQTAPLRRIVRELRADLDRLGPAPEEGAPPESSAIAAERARLNQRIADLDGAIRQSDLNIADAERILEDIREQRRERFFSDLFERTRTPFNPRVWSDAATTFAAGADRLAAEVGAWQAEKEQTGEWQMTVLLIVALEAARQRGRLDADRQAEIVTALRGLAARLNLALDTEAITERLSQELAEAQELKGWNAAKNFVAPFAASSLATRLSKGLRRSAVHSNVTTTATATSRPNCFRPCRREKPSRGRSQRPAVHVIANASPATASSSSPTGYSSRISPITSVG